MSPRRLGWSLCASFLCACSSAVDVTAVRGAVSFHFDDVGCAVRYVGDRGAGPSAIDLTCPGNLRGHGRPTLHISTPLVTGAKELALRDEHFRQPGYQLGQFVVVTYTAEGKSVTCDPLQAQGSIVYSSVPRPGAGDRFAGTFSEDASLLNCRSEAGSDGNLPLSLRGGFDLLAP